MKSWNIVFPQKEQVALVEQEVPAPGQGEILCASVKSLISTGTETLCLRGVSDPDTSWDRWVKFPFQPGYSVAAKVLETGEGVTDVKAGDYVAADVPHQQYFTVARNRVLPIPEKVNVEDAAWYSLARVAQLGVRRAALDLGETVGVVGMGMVGQLVLQYLWLAGCRRVFCIDPVESRLSFAEPSDAVRCLAMDATTARSEIAKATHGRMLDVVFDVTGHPSVLAPATQLVRKLGRVILLGDTVTPSQQHLGPRIVADSISIMGIHGTMSPKEASEFNPWSKDEMDRLFFDYMGQQRLHVAKLVSHRFSPLQAAEVYQQLVADRNEYMGVIFDWDALSTPGMRA